MLGAIITRPSSTGRATRALRRALTCALTCVPLAAGAARAQQDTSTPEVFEATDPYTTGKEDALERAGYVSLGPFTLAQGIPTADVEESLGGLQVLWVETAHFKLGSRLHAYRRGTDDVEEKKLSEELRRLSKKIPRVRTNVREINPWLRLHLYAQRLEEQYADFQALAGVTDADFPGKKVAGGKPADAMGEGRYLGCESKFTVLLTERRTQVERFARRFLTTPESSWYRNLLPGGSWFFGASAEIVQMMGTPLDSAFHALVANGVSHSLLSGFRGTTHARPMWFAHGLALDYGRKAEPRWCVFIVRESPGPDDETWLWEERVGALLKNKFTPAWEEMLGWKDVNALGAREHMVAWSRVAWLADADKASFQKLLRAFTTDPDPAPDGSIPRTLSPAAQTAVLQAALGKSPSELEEAWAKWVRRKYPRK